MFLIIKPYNTRRYGQREKQQLPVKKHRTFLGYMLQCLLIAVNSFFIIILRSIFCHAISVIIAIQSV